tara:strand:+ start:140 stop:637 length:498 start_codon:yes stop_codon:yes gene_type:complete
MFETQNNFLPVEQFDELQNLILDSDFPWRVRENMVEDIKDDNLYFTYGFFNNNNVTSELYPRYIIPILEKLKCMAPIQVRANMFLNKIFDRSGWHIDYNSNNTTAILYLNDCDGGTELKINNKIEFVKAEKNKLLTFPSNTTHRARTSTDVDRRYIMNFNYFTHN